MRGYQINVATILFSMVAISGFSDTGTQTGRMNLQEWALPAIKEYLPDSGLNQDQVTLGEMLFFDPRLSADGSVSCASCHNPMLGWSDNRRFSVGVGGAQGIRSTPTVINSVYNYLQMWDGRERTLESQALSPLRSETEMNSDLAAVIEWLEDTPGYKSAFTRAFPGEKISEDTIAGAIATFERTLVSGDSPFDRWVKGDPDAMTPAQIRGFSLFIDPDKGRCVDCHWAPNFTDDGFHNIGLPSYGGIDPDLGRYNVVPIAVLKGAFKTPTLRNVALTAPYFHDGSAATLYDVIDHYITGGIVKQDLSPTMKPLNLTNREKDDLVKFLHSLTSPVKSFALPILPRATNLPQHHTTSVRESESFATRGE